MRGPSGLPGLAGALETVAKINAEHGFQDKNSV